MKALLTKLQVACYIFEDVKDVVLEDGIETLLVREGTMSKDDSHKDYLLEGPVESLESRTRQDEEQGGSGGPEGGSDEKPAPRTPSKKQGSGVQINLEKDSNSKKIENKFRLDFTEDTAQKKILCFTPQKLIVQNVEDLLRVCEPFRQEMGGRQHEPSEKIRSFTMGSEVRSLLFHDEFGSSQTKDSIRVAVREANKTLPTGRSDKYCNPCTLI